MTDLRDKVVWITGASGGIGEALAQRAAARGAKLILSARREAELDRVQQSLPRPQDAALLPVDLGQLDDANALAARAADFFGPIDVLANNAGLSQRTSALDTDMAGYRHLMEVDFFAPIAQLLVIGQRCVNPLTPFAQLVNLEAPARQPLQHPPMGVEGHPVPSTKAITKDVQGPAGGDAWVKLAERAGRGVAWIGEGGFPLLLAAGIQALKVALSHVNFAAHLQALWKRCVCIAAQPQGDGFDGAEILCDLLAAHPVATG